MLALTKICSLFLKLSDEQLMSVHIFTEIIKSRNQPAGIAGKQSSYVALLRDFKMSKADEMFS